jgi:hypothetical protein
MPFDLDAFLARLGIEHKAVPHNGGTKFLLERCPFNPEHGFGEAAVFQSADGTLGFHCFHDSCTGKKWSDLRELVDGYARRHDHGPSGRPLWPDPLDLEALAEREPQPPRFIIDDWLPEGYATLFTGHGGMGKSTIALLLSVCIAAGIPFFGLHVERRRVLYLSCEDREQVLHWRLSRICRYLGIDLASLRGWLDIVDLVGHPCVLWQRDPHTGASITAAFGALQARMQAQETQVLFGDGVSDLFGGSENTRSEVKAFVNALLGMIPIDGALILNGHVDKTTANNGAVSQGYSGSTQWHNAARARWYLYAEQELDEENAKQRTGSLVLELQKSNHGIMDQRFVFAWDDEARLFLPTEAPAVRSSADEASLGRVERVGILRALMACDDLSPPVSVPAALMGQRTAYTVLCVRPELPASLKQGRNGKNRFKRRLEEVRQAGLVYEIDIARQDRHKTRCLAATPLGRATVAESEQVRD